MFATSRLVLPNLTQTKYCIICTYHFQVYIKMTSGFKFFMSFWKTQDLLSFMIFVARHMTKRAKTIWKKCWVKLWRKTLQLFQTLKKMNNKKAIKLLRIYRNVLVVYSSWLFIIWLLGLIRALLKPFVIQWPQESPGHVECVHR